MSDSGRGTSFGMTRFDGQQTIPSLGILTSEGGLPGEADSQRPRCRVLPARLIVVGPSLRPVSVAREVDGTMGRVIFGKEIVNLLPHSRFEGMLMEMRLCFFQLSQGLFSMLRSDAHVGEAALALWSNEGQPPQVSNLCCVRGPYNEKQ